MYKMTLRSCATGREGVGVGIERYLRSCHVGDAAPTLAGNYCRPLFEGTAPYLKPPALKPSRFGGHMIYDGAAGTKTQNQYLNVRNAFFRSNYLSLGFSFMFQLIHLRTAMRIKSEITNKVKLLFYIRKHSKFDHNRPNQKFPKCYHFK